MSKKYRYVKGTGDSAQKDLDSDKTPNYMKSASMLEAMQHFYKGKINLEWQ